MKFSAFNLRPVLQLGCRTRFRFFCSSPSISDLETTVSDEVQTILDNVDHIEDSLECLVPFLSPEVVTSVIREQKNVQLSFRFFIWAMKRKHFRCWESHNLMIDMLCGVGDFEVAWSLLEELRDSKIPIVSHVFTVLITAYAKSGKDEKAVETFGRMKDFDCKPDTFTCNTILHFFVRKDVYPLALAVYNQMLKCDWRPNRATFVILIDGSFKARRTQDALKMFDEMSHIGISSNLNIYTTVISGLICQSGRIDDAYRLLSIMKNNSCYPDSVSYNSMLNGLCKLGRIDEAFELLQSFIKEGFVLGLNGYSCLIDGLVRAGRFDEAHYWYQRMLEENIVPDRILYTIMMKGLLKAGKMRDALNVLNEMTERGIEPDTYFYNTLIKGFCDVGLLDKARSLQLEISKHHCSPETATYTILICGLCREGMLGEAREIFNEMEKLGCCPSVKTFNALIDGLCKVGEIEKAHLLFYKMEIGRNPSLILRLSQGSDQFLDNASLQTVVERLCESGSILNAYKLLMQVAYLPNIYTYNILLNGLCKAGNVNGALNLFKDLVIKGYSPDAVTYGTLINGLRWANKEDAALGIFNQMVMNGYKPSLAIYRAVMTSLCNKGKLSQAFNLWLEYLRNLPHQEGEAIQMVEYQFEKGEFEAALRSLLNMDLKCRIVNPSPYTIWLIGLCKTGRLDDALNIFSVLMEYKVDVTPPTCVALINSLCKEGKLGHAVDVFMYSVQKGFILNRPVCNHLIRSLLRSEHKKKHAIEILSKMRSAGYYNMNVFVDPTTKALLHSHWNANENISNYPVGSPGNSVVEMLFQD